MNRVLINTGGLVREVPEGAAYIETSEASFQAWDAGGNPIDPGPSIPLDNPPWYRRIPVSDAASHDN